MEHYAHAEGGGMAPPDVGPGEALKLDAPDIGLAVDDLYRLALEDGP